MTFDNISSEKCALYFHNLPPVHAYGLYLISYRGYFFGSRQKIVELLRFNRRYGVATDSAIPETA